MKKLIYTTASIFLLFSCSHKTVGTTVETKPSAPASAPVVASKTSVADGEKIYQTSCGRCHDLKNPNEYTVNEWRPIMNRMAPKARLNDDQKNNVLAFLIQNAKPVK
jgi:cytochrome c5